MFLLSFGITGVNSIFILYVTFRFGWTPRTIGFYATFVMVSSLADPVGSGVANDQAGWANAARY